MDLFKVTTSGKRVQEIRWHAICVSEELNYGKSALVLFGIDLVENVQLLRGGVHILGDNVEDAPHAVEIVVRAGVNGLVFRVVGMQAVRPRKSIFKDQRKAVRFKEAIQHQFGHSSAGRGSCFVLF